MTMKPIGKIIIDPAKSYSVTIKNSTKSMPIFMESSLLWITESTVLWSSLGNGCSLVASFNQPFIPFFYFKKHGILLIAAIPFLCGPVTARFVTRFNLWLRHDLWPHNASICDPARFVTKSASICDQRYTMILESKLCRGKLVFVFTLIMYTKWYNMIIYIYELWYDAYINSGARSLMLLTLILF